MIRRKMLKRRVKSTPRRPEPNGMTPSDYQEKAQQAEARQDWKAASFNYTKAFTQRSAELALINSVQEGLSAKLEMQAIYNLVGDKLRDTFNAQVVMISQYDPHTNQIYHHYAIERGQHLQIYHWSPIDSSRLRIVRTGRPYCINLAEIQRVVGAGMMNVVPGTELPKTWLGVPMLVGNEVKGIVSLQNLDRENAFSKSDIDLLMTLAHSLSSSLENARLFDESQRLLKQLEEEMEIARQTQQSILPSRLPKHAGYDLGALMRPARAVGGDFYDFIQPEKKKLCIVIGDVSDKGLPAALFMALTFSLVRVETGKLADPVQILRSVNRYLLNMNASGMYVTLLYCVLDFETGLLTYSRAGHLPPVLLDANGGCIRLEMNTGQPLGLFNDVLVDAQQTELPPGGLALLFSDGLNEAASPAGEEFGDQRVRRELLIHRHEPAEAICQALWRAVQDHSGPNLHQDDFTTVVIKRDPQYN